MKDLKIFRIILFAVVLLVVHVSLGALIPSFEEYEKPGARAFWLIIEYLVQATFEITIFAQLARLQARLLYVHLVCVLVLYWLLGYALVLAVFGHTLESPLMVAVLDYSVFVVSIIVGTVIGRHLRFAAEKKADLAGTSPHG